MIPEKNKTYFISYEEDYGYSGKAMFTGKKFEHPYAEEHPNFPGKYFLYEFQLIDKSKLYPKREFVLFAEEDIVYQIDSPKKEKNKIEKTKAVLDSLQKSLDLLIENGPDIQDYWELSQHQEHVHLLGMIVEDYKYYYKNMKE